MAWLEGGQFAMGSNRHYPEEAPIHQVKVDGFFIDRHPVTNREFARFVEETGFVTFAEKPPNPEDYPGALPEMLYAGSLVFSPPRHRVDTADWSQWWIYLKGADWRHPYGPKATRSALPQHPVVHVTYEDALAYAQWAGKDLPTEAEWEYAARAGTTTAYSFGDDEDELGRYAWYGENFIFGGTHPVGQKEPNPWGLYDIHGNAWEWVQDWFDPNYYASSPAVDPQGPQRGTERVVRGGSWHTTATSWRTAFRRDYAPDYRGISIGFRLLRTVEEAL